MHDSKQEMNFLACPSNISELMYADDTLLVGVHDNLLQSYMTTIGRVGAEYGLSFNWSKLEVLPVRATTAIYKPDGTAVQNKDSMLYLGSSLSADGRAGSELNRRLGMARADFSTLARVWKHASISRRRKLQILNACIISKLS